MNEQERELTTAEAAQLGQLMEAWDGIFDRIARRRGPEAVEAARIDAAELMRDFNRELAEGVPHSEASAVFGARMRSRLLPLMREAS